MGIKPEDILADDKNTVNFGNITVRKATMGAALANVEVLESKNTTEAEKSDARKMLAELAPALVAIGILKHLSWKNPEVQKIIEEHG
jgi:hypothetical protein